MRKRKKSPPSILPRSKKERRRLEVLSGSALLCVAGVIVFAFFAASAERFLIGLPQTAAVVTAVLTDLANGDRAANNLTALKVNPLLVAAAQAKADDMAAKGYFAHVSPVDGKDPWFWFKEAGYNFTYAGENLAVDFSDSSDVERAWMNSPAHRENILDPRYSEIGIATAVGMYEGHQTIFVVQEFGTPAPAAQPVASAAAQQSSLTADVPQSPTKPATAVKHIAAPRPLAAVEKTTATTEPPQVLGTSESGEATAMVVEVQPLSAPVAYAVGSPKTSLRYLYYVIGFFLILALAYTTRFEMKKHHLRHVGAVSGLVLLMGCLLLVGDLVVFSSPTISQGAASSQTRL